MVIISVVKIAVLILWIQFRDYTLATKFNNIKKLDWWGAGNHSGHTGPLKTSGGVVISCTTKYKNNLNN
jgi:hypothetical protein